MAEDNTTIICVECKERGGDLNIRNRRLCVECFSRYVNSKVLKRMESYRFKALDEDQKRRLLVPLSGGVSSLVLLQVLDTQLKRQIANRNKTAYDLIIAHVVPLDQSAAVISDQQLTRLAQRFSNHEFLPSFALPTSLSFDEHIEEDLRNVGCERRDQEPDVDFFNRIMSSATSVTTRTDLQSILLQRLIVAIAKVHGCDSIIWGHSDSRLAAMTLADVAKGRGGSVASTIADGLSPFGINFNHPLRDLYKTELEIYASTLPEPLTEASTASDGAILHPPSLRNTAIDSLLTDYINTQGIKYPSIMANVVRTGGKLEVRPNDNVCRLCVQPTLNSGSPSSPVPSLCYGCTRIKQDMRT